MLFDCSFPIYPCTVIPDITAWFVGLASLAEIFKKKPLRTTTTDYFIITNIYGCLPVAWGFADRLIVVVVSVVIVTAAQRTFCPYRDFLTYRRRVASYGRRFNSLLSHN